jgi:hypothetical protein
MIQKNIFGDLPAAISPFIIAKEIRHHGKASEAYIDASFRIGSEWVETSIPVNYRRTGVDAQTASDCLEILETARTHFDPNKINSWLANEKAFWETSKKDVTKEFFSILLTNLSNWVCQGCMFPQNPNWARRTQYIKDQGYTLSTNTNLFCSKCQSAKSHLMLIPLPRGAASDYETISPKLKQRIIKVLNSIDSFEGSLRPESSLLPDHKFPEIRWDEETGEVNDDDMSAADIIKKFQLINNQRNQQKREVCRQCYQDGKRGKPFGISYFYAGNENWPESIPKRGKEAEEGCFGCGWYDLSAWRNSLNMFLESISRGS